MKTTVVEDELLFKVLTSAELVLCENPDDENCKETKLVYGMGIHDETGWKLMFHREPPKAVAWQFRAGQAGSRWTECDEHSFNNPVYGNQYRELFDHPSTIGLGANNESRTL